MRARATGAVYAPAAAGHSRGCPARRAERPLSASRAPRVREREAGVRRCPTERPTPSGMRSHAMRATLRLGRIRGIELGAHWSVLVIGGLLAFGLSGGVVDGVLWAVVVPTVLLFLGSLLAHELGALGRRPAQRDAGPGHHALDARRRRAARGPDADGRRRVPHRGRRPGGQLRCSAAASSARGASARRSRRVSSLVGPGLRVARVREHRARRRSTSSPPRRSTAAASSPSAVWARPRRPHPRRDRRDPGRPGLRRRC